MANEMQQQTKNTKIEINVVELNRKLITRNVSTKCKSDVELQQCTVSHKLLVLNLIAILIL